MQRVHPATRVHLSLLILILLGSALYWTSNPARALSAARPSTPMLIEQAYARHEITTGQRLVYLAYALYEPQSLPTRFQSTTGWFGTQYVTELQPVFGALRSRQMTPFAAPEATELTRIAPMAATVCDKGSLPLSKETDNFHFNYASLGALTPELYLSALEVSFDTLVKSDGWGKPPTTSKNPWHKYPVQAANIAASYYGYVTTTGGSYTANVGDNPNTPGHESNAHASCMVLNRNFAQFPKGALKSLEVTAAHEYTHSIQFGYGVMFPPEDDMWIESGAAYAEDEVFPTIHDNYQYLFPKLGHCLGDYPYSTDPNNGPQYSNWLFFRYVSEQNGGLHTPGGGEEVYKAFMENIAAGQHGLFAFNNALGTKGTNLQDTFHDYAIATHFLKTCPTAAPYCYSDAAGFSHGLGALPTAGDVEEIGDQYDGKVENNYAVNTVGLPNDGIYSVTVNNPGASGKLRVSVVADLGEKLDVTPFPQPVGQHAHVTLDEYIPPPGASSIVAVITNEDQTDDDPSSCSRDGYTIRADNPISFVIDTTSSMFPELFLAQGVTDNMVDDFTAKGEYHNYHLRDGSNQLDSSAITPPSPTAAR